MIRVNNTFNIENLGKFWDLNPELAIFYPYSELYEKDKTEDKEWSSRAMWVIFFMSYPDEEVNFFAKKSIDEVKKSLNKTIAKDISYTNPAFKKCLKAFPNDCLSLMERTLKIEEQELIKRTELLKETELTLDTTQIVTDAKGGEKAVTVKGTASQINTLQKDFGKIIETYQKIRNKYIEEKSEISLYGGGKRTKAEEGLLD